MEIATAKPADTAKRTTRDNALRFQQLGPKLRSKGFGFFAALCFFGFAQSGRWSGPARDRITDEFEEFVLARRCAHAQ